MTGKTDTATDNVAAALGGVVIDETGSAVAENVRTRLLENTRTIDSFEGAIQALIAAGIAPENASEYELVEKNAKATLCGVPMVFLNWRFNTDETGKEFVSVEAVTKDGRKVVFNDGSKGGVRDQLKEFTQHKLDQGATLAAARCGLVANGGLRKSDYTEADGAAASGTSWYVQGLPVAKM